MKITYLGHSCFCIENTAGVKIITEHAQFAERLPLLFKKAFSVGFDSVLTRESRAGRQVTIFRIDDREKLASIYEALELPEGGNVALHLNRGVVEQECCEVAFVRGAFLSGGSVIDPEKRYHLELATAHRQVSAELYSLLLDYCSTAYITMINAEAEADRFFPNIDKMANWHLVSESEVKEHEGVTFTFRVYENISVKEA